MKAEVIHIQHDSCPCCNTTSMCMASAHTTLHKSSRRICTEARACAMYHMLAHIQSIQCSMKWGSSICNISSAPSSTTNSVAKRARRFIYRWTEDLSGNVHDSEGCKVLSATSGLVPEIFATRARHPNIGEIYKIRGQSLGISIQLVREINAYLHGIINSYGYRWI